MQTLTWLPVPPSWARAAFALTQACQHDCELSSASQDTFASLLTSAQMAAGDMARARVAAAAEGPAPVSGPVLITSDYRAAVVTLCDAMRADCQHSAASSEQFKAALDEFDLALKEEAAPPDHDRNTVRTFLQAAARGGLVEAIKSGKLAEEVVLRVLGFGVQEPQAKALVFEAVGDASDQLERCQTPFGSYELQGFPRGYLVTFIFGNTHRRIHDKVGLTREGAFEKAQGDFDRRVLECLSQPVPAAAAAAPANTTSPPVATTTEPVVTRVTEPKRPKPR